MLLDISSGCSGHRSLPAQKVVREKHMSIRVSVVVPTYKRPALLQRCLYALLAQDLAPEDYEIIVVDDAHCSETRQQVEKWIASAQLTGHTLHYLSVPATSA